MSKFYTPLTVRFNETDLQGHVNFGHYYFYFDAGITDYLGGNEKGLPYSYQDMLDDNTDFLYAESHCNHKSSAQWPEILHVYTRVGYMSRRSLRFEFEVRAKNDNRLIAVGYIAAVTADKTTFTPHPIPERMRQAILAYEENVETPA